MTINKNDLNTYFVQFLAASGGVALSIILLFQHTRLKSGIQDSASFCSLGKLADCDVVNASSHSELFGVPIASIGAIFYFFLLVCLLFAPPESTNFRAFRTLVTRLAAVGLVVDTYLLIVSLFFLRTLCLLCVGTYLCTGLLFLAGCFQTGRRFRVRETLLPSQTAPFSVPAPNAVLLLLTVGAFGWTTLLIPANVKLQSRMYAYVNTAIQQYYAGWKEKPQSEIAIRENDPNFGDPDSKVKIVEFSDYECPFCQKAAFTLHAAIKPLRNRVHFVFKNFPLDSSCNPNVVYQMHPMACRLAQLGYCAQKKGVFWDYHDEVFFKISKEGKLPDWQQVTQKLTRFFNAEEINACLQDSKTRKLVQEDITLGKKHGVKGTPAIFINGKLVQDIPITVETIRRLIELEIQAG